MRRTWYLNRATGLSNFYFLSSKPEKKWEGSDYIGLWCDAQFESLGPGIRLSPGQSTPMTVRKDGLCLLGKKYGKKLHTYELCYSETENNVQFKLSNDYSTVAYVIPKRFKPANTRKVVMCKNGIYFK